LDRAIRIASAILTAASKRGYTVKINDASSYRRDKEVQIVVDGIPLSLEMFEPVRQTKHVPTATEQREIDRGRTYMVPTYDFHSTGKLQLTLNCSHGGGMTWRDTRDQQLEHQLGSVLETMMTLSKAAQERLKRRFSKSKAVLMLNPSWDNG
jgi:hypothetical protein